MIVCKQRRSLGALALVLSLASSIHSSVAFTTTPPTSVFKNKAVWNTLILHYTNDDTSSSHKTLNDDDGEESMVSSTFVDKDWWQSELTVLNAPTEPDPSLSAEEVAINCIRSLQWVDLPTPNAGLKRCYNFFTYGCRERVTARRGGKTVESFAEYGLYAPPLQPFMGASRVEIGECTYTPAKPPLRGAWASFLITIHGAEVLSVRHQSGMDRQGVTSDLPVTNMVMRLEQQRRPPNQGCWLICELMDVRHVFAGDMGNAHVGG